MFQLYSLWTDFYETLFWGMLRKIIGPTQLFSHDFTWGSTSVSARISLNIYREKSVSNKSHTEKINIFYAKYIFSACLMVSEIEQKGHYEYIFELHIQQSTIASRIQWRLRKNIGRSLLTSDWVKIKFALFLRRGALLQYDFEADITQFYVYIYIYK
jgi:hypothetical protein